MVVPEAEETFSIGDSKSSGASKGNVPAKGESTRVGCLGYLLRLSQHSFEYQEFLES